MHLQWLSTVFGCFAIVLDVCCKYFNCMLQVFYLDVAKVDLVLHMLQWDRLPQPSDAVACAPPSGRRRLLVGSRGGVSDLRVL